MKFSMIQAAKEVGVSKSAMHRYIHSGKISANKLDNGYEIDASELFRVFPDGWKAKEAGTVPEPPTEDNLGLGGTTAGTSNEIGSLRAEVKLLREMLERADFDLDRERRTAADAIEDYRNRLDKESEDRRALNLRLLAYQKPLSDVPPPSGLKGDIASSIGTLGRRGLFGLFKRAG